MGFAIPVDAVNRIVPQLIQHGRLIRPGIGIVPFRDQRTRQFQLTGLLVREVQPNSPASEIGIRPTQMVEYSRGFRTFLRIQYGDLIVAGNGEPIEDLDAWFSFLEKHKAGDQVTLTLIRDLRTPDQQKIDVEIKLAPSDE